MPEKDKITKNKKARQRLGTVTFYFFFTVFTSNERIHLQIKRLRHSNLNTINFLGYILTVSWGLIPSRFYYLMFDVSAFKTYIKNAYVIYSLMTQGEILNTPIKYVVIV